MGLPNSGQLNEGGVVVNLKIVVSCVIAGEGARATQINCRSLTS